MNESAEGGKATSLYGSVKDTEYYGSRGFTLCGWRRTEVGLNHN